MKATTTSLETVEYQNETFFKIANHNTMRPFFMSIVSDSNHWMFISSNGGLTAGRKNAQYALFPYYTDDKITESAHITGSKTIIKGNKDQKAFVWEPFTKEAEQQFNLTRNLYKNTLGNKIIFEEINHDVQLTFKYQWASSNLYGFVRTSEVSNQSETTNKVELIDGIQNIVPFGVGSELQNRASNLVDAYKRNELDEDSGLGIYALSAIIVDRAEPSEALKANVAWSLGIQGQHLVSSKQLAAFKEGETVHQETDVKAEKGAYFVHSTLEIPSNEAKEWHIVANVNQDHAGVVSLCEQLKDSKTLTSQVLADVALGSKNLVKLVAASDGLQQTADSLKDTRHFSNTMFNIMRGGIFDDNYTIEKKDFLAYLQGANKKVAKANGKLFKPFTETFTLQELFLTLKEQEDKDLNRLVTEYLPLKFSRRHGDPSRPWNIFSINTHSEIDGSKILDYQGNWRDIFQNWEALAHSYPQFIEGMLFKFLNASTFDGYNPYRVTKGGFDWETIEPDDPWAYIGYWGDHQIIYSLKFLEFIQQYFPDKLMGYFNEESFVYANVPYKIKDYQSIVKNSKDTIDFDVDLDHAIRKERAKIGADAALLNNKEGEIHHVSFIEKILASVLAKLSNLIPEGGIWMNTQRPEWNDANNALVGNGVSMVTLYYLRRYLNFFLQVLAQEPRAKHSLSKEMVEWFEATASIFQKHQTSLTGTFTNQERKHFVDAIGEAASAYRTKIYKRSFSGKKQNLSNKKLVAFFESSNAYLEHAIRANEREDGLYHGYNLLTFTEDNGIAISYLDEMLEGQVAALSAGYLSVDEVLSVLDGLRNSALYREDQNSYILYPNKQLKGFLQKNSIRRKRCNHQLCYRI